MHQGYLGACSHATNMRDCEVLVLHPQLLWGFHWKSMCLFIIRSWNTVHTRSVINSHRNFLMCQFHTGTHFIRIWKGVRHQVPFWTVIEHVVDVLTKESLDRIGTRLKISTCAQMAMCVLSALIARKLHSNPCKTTVVCKLWFSWWSKTELCKLVPSGSACWKKLVTYSSVFGEDWVHLRG
jgi:hypothetical protein